MKRLVEQENPRAGHGQLDGREILWVLLFFIGIPLALATAVGGAAHYFLGSSMVECILYGVTAVVLAVRILIWSDGR